MNTYSKYAPNVFCAKCTEEHQKGDIIILETKYGKEHECIVFNFLFQKNEFYYYSIVRADGFNIQEYAKKKAERYIRWAESAENKSDQYWKASQEGKEFLSLGEPIKVGHHSEKRHRNLIERNYERWGKSVAESNKAKDHESKSEYWEKRANDINLSMPESLEYFEHKLEQAKELHEGLKSGKYERRHSYSLTYAKNDVNKMQDNLKLATKLWGE